LNGFSWLKECKNYISHEFLQCFCVPADGHCYLTQQKLFERLSIRDTMLLQYPSLISLCSTPVGSMFKGVIHDKKSIKCKVN
jgi:hypothetical protein